MEYFLCEYCEKDMHEAYANGDGLSYVPDRYNSANIHYLMCSTPSNILGDIDSKEGDGYTLLIDQVRKLKEENKRLKMEKPMLDTKRKALKLH